MQPFILLATIASIAPHVLAQTATSEADHFSSAASQLISLYIPASAASAIVSIASRNHIHGTPAAVLESALTAAATPRWLTAATALAAYQPNIRSLDSALSELRSAAAAGDGGSISGAPRVLTRTDGDGATFVTTSTPAAAAVDASSAAATASSSADAGPSASASPSASADAGSSTPDAASSSSASGSGQSAATLTTVTGTASPHSSATLEATGVVSSSSSGLAFPTRLPFGVAGVFGLAGVAIVL